ncbi:MAG: lipopolysaccharide biosynthesis protein [Gemmatimonadales bacterium]
MTGVIDTPTNEVAQGAPPLSTRLIAGGAWLASAQIVRRLTGVLVLAVLARLLTPADFGLASLTFIVVGYVSLFSELGVSSALVQRQTLTEDHLRSAFWITTGGGILLAALAALLSSPIARLLGNERLAPLIAVAMLVVPIGGMGQVADALLQRRLAFRSIALIEWASTILSAVVSVVLALSGAGVWALVAQSITAALALAVGRNFAAGWRPGLSFSAPAARAIMGFGGAALGVTVIGYLTRTIDNLVVGSRLGAEALGYYSMAYGLILLPLVTIGGIVIRTASPALASLQTDRPRLTKAYLRTVRTLASATLPMALGIAAVAPELVATVYGPQWQPAVKLLRILAIIGSLDALNTSGLIFFSIGRLLLLLRYACVSLAVMFAAFVIGSRWGVDGVAWAYVIASPVIFLGPHVLGDRLISLPLRTHLRAVAPALTSALLMALVVTASRSVVERLVNHVPARLAVLVTIGAVVYAAALFTWNALSSEDESPLPFHFASMLRRIRTGSAS